MKSGVFILILASALSCVLTQSNPPSCIGITNGYTYANVYGSNEYYLCQNSIPIPMVCPGGYVFCNTGVIGACLPSCSNFNQPATESPVPTAPTVPGLPGWDRNGNQCANQPNNVIFPLSGSCSGYITCLNGVSINGNCAGNRQFDATTGVCSESYCY